MPGGSYGLAGARGAGRFFRNASFSAVASLGTASQLALDADSALVSPVNVQRDAGGDMQALVAGLGSASVCLTASGVLTLSALRVMMTRSPGTAREKVFLDRRIAAPTSGQFSVQTEGLVDLDALDTVRTDVLAIGVQLLPMTTGGELFTWASLVVGSSP